MVYIMTVVQADRIHVYNHCFSPTSAMNSQQK